MTRNRSTLALCTTCCAVMVVIACGKTDGFAGRPTPIPRDAGSRTVAGGGGGGASDVSEAGSTGATSGSSDGAVSPGPGSTGGDGGTAGAGAGGSASVGDGAADGGAPGSGDAWWPHDTAVGCRTAGVPLETDRVKSDAGDTIAPIYLAMNRIRLGAVDETPDPANPGLVSLTPDPDAWKDIGFDIDGKCTNSATCQMDDLLVQERACSNSETIPFDGNDCRDNTIGKLFNFVATAPNIGGWFGISEPDWNCELWRGGFSVILKISNYNGQANDADVRVDLYTSVGKKELPAWACRASIDQPLATDWNKRAPWSARDHWIISSDSISLAADHGGNDVPDSRWADASAYVRGGWLVTHLPDGSWFWLDGERTPSPGMRLLMHRNVIATRLVQDPQSGGWTMEDGTLGFVTTPQEVIDGFSQLGLCENMCGTFATMKGFLNTYQDAPLSSASTDPVAPCDAVSNGVAFRAAQIAADATDVEQTSPFATCPQPRHPDAPRQGCTCSADGSRCTLTDGGS